ncbi:MAG TPA: hypothetical protein VGM50_07030, partial [Gemmatimonadaceae bacterium]
MRRLSVALILTIAASATAQNNSSSRFMDNCKRSWGDDERFCEERNFTMAAMQALSVDARANGGVTVHGWDKG